MTNETKKENKLKAFLVEHEDGIKRICRDMFWYGLGIGVGYFIFRPGNKEMRKFFKTGTRGTILANFPAEETTTVAEFFGESANCENLTRLGIQATDKIVGVMCSIAKSET